MSKFVNFGILCMKKDKSGFYIKLDRELELTVNGDKVDTDFINVQAPTVKYERMLKADKITKEEYDEKVARFDKEGDLNYIRQELTVVLD